MQRTEKSIGNEGEAYCVGGVVVAEIENKQTAKAPVGIKRQVGARSRVYTFRMC